MKFIIAILLLILTGSCNQNSQNKNFQEKLDLDKSQIIELHDSLMLDMKVLKKLKQSLLIIMDDTILFDQKDQIETVLTEIDKVDESMWDWMHNFDIAFSSKDDSATLAYYNRKLETLKGVEYQFNSTIERTKKLID